MGSGPPADRHPPLWENTRSQSGGNTLSQLNSSVSTGKCNIVPYIWFPLDKSSGNYDLVTSWSKTCGSVVVQEFMLSE